MKGWKPKFRRWISLLTVSALTACMIPLTSTAEVTQEEESSGFVDMADVPENIRALFTLDDIPATSQARANRAGALEYTAMPRIVDTDDLNSIRMETPDGQGIAKVFAAPVRYENDKGEIEFIDTSMTAENPVTALFTGYDYRNTANDIDIRFSKRPSKGIRIDNLFSMAVYSPDVASLPNGSIDQTDEGNGRMVYPKAFGEHTYLEYININTGLKENIVLEKNVGTNRFSFVLESKEYIPILSDDRLTVSIVHKDNPDDVKYQFQPLYVYDSYQPEAYDTIEAEPSREPVYVGSAAGTPEENAAKEAAPAVRHYTEDNHYEIVTLGNGKYAITSVVSEEFLNSPDTIYPVTIDPSFTGTNSDSQDTFVWENEGSKLNKNGNLDYLRFGKKDGGRIHAYFRFASLPTIPNNVNITDAQLKFTFRSGQTSGADGICMIVTDHQWHESSLTWFSQPYGAWGFGSSHNNYQYYNFYVKPFVESWYNGSIPNYGIDFTYKNMINDYNSCVSTEGEAKRAPQLTITYNREIGLPAGLSTNAIYYIRNNNSGKYLQTGISTQATVTQNSFTNHRNQQWQLVHAGYGWYNIVPMSNLSLQLDVPNSSDTNGMRTQIYTSKNSNSQRFRLYDNGNGTVRIQPECSYISETEHGRNTNRVLEVENSSSSNGAKVQLWEYNGSKTMQWKFIQTPDSQDNSILSPEDRASILSLKRDYILYRNQGSSIYDYDGMCVSIMRAIDVIRRQSYYKGKYAFSDSAGTCNWTYMYEDGYTSSMKFHPITIETRPPEDYTLACNWALTIASAVTPWPYNAFIEVIGLSMLPSEPIDLISFSLTLFREEKWVTEGKLGTIATLTSLFSSAADAAANPPIGSDDFQVRIWYFNPNDISAIESYRIFVRSSFKVRHETQRSENVSSPPGYPTYDRNDLSYHNWTRHGSSKPGLVVNF